jgi:hypothetical protein
MIEWGEVYAKEGAQLAPSIVPPVDETSLFAGSLMALPQGVKHGWDVAASAMANASMPVLEKVTPDSMTAWLEDQRRVANESMKATRTDPRTMGTVGQLIHGVSSILTMGVAGAPLGPVGAAGAIGGLSMFDKSTELIEQGVDLQTAQKVGAVTGTVMGVGAALPPFIGGTLTKQIASGIGINVGLGMTERAASSEILEDKYAGIAQHYKALDGTAIAIDAVLGAAFPIGARLLKRPSVAQIDDAQDANRVVAEQSRDPALQATLEGIERNREIADDVTRQILEENRPLGDIEIPANAMDDVVPNEQFGKTASIAAKAIDDLMIQENGMGVGQAEADISTLAKAFNPVPVEVKPVDVLSVPVEKVGADTTAKLEGLDPWITPKTFEEKLYEFKNALLDLQQQFGWAEVGGKLIRQQEAGDLGLGSGEVLGRTQWLPKADWWPGKPKSLTEKTGSDLVQKVLEGKTLTKADKANLEFLVGIMREQKKQKALGIEGKNDGVRPDAELEAGMVERLAKIDEGLVESLATRFEDTDAFMKEVKKALDEFDAKQEEFKLTGQTEAEIKAAEATRVRLEEEAKAKAAAPSPDSFMLTGSNRAADVGAAAGQASIFDASPDQFTKQAARGIIESDPTMTVMDENGNAVVAKDLLDQAETKFQQETKEADLFKVAVACAIGVGE